MKKAEIQCMTDGKISKVVIPLNGSSLKGKVKTSISKIITSTKSSINFHPSSSYGLINLLRSIVPSLLSFQHS